MDAHNNSQVVARFFGIAKPILDGDVVLVTGTEIFRQGLTRVAVGNTHDRAERFTYGNVRLF
jgi:hypothetical protein